MPKAKEAKPKTPASVTPGVFRELKPADLIASPTNPRTEFDVSDLIDSVRQHGILQPIVVRPHPKQKGKFEIVAGERRWRTAKQVPLDRVPAMLHQYTDEQVLEIQIVENLQRENISEMDEALGFKRLVKMGIKAEDIAARVGKSKAYVYAAMKIAELTTHWAERLRDKKIQRSHAVLLARLQPKDQVAVLRHYEGRTAISVEDLDDYIRRTLMLRLEAAPFRPDDAALLPSAGACTGCPKRTGNNPALYADVKEKDVCTDRSCYEAKIDNTLVKIEKDLKTKGETVVRISGEYWGQGLVDKRVLTKNVYRELKSSDKECHSTCTGLYVDSKLVGHKRRVCIEPKCKTHKRNEGGGYHMSAEEKARRKQQKEEDAYHRSCADVLLDRVRAAAAMQTSFSRLEIEWLIVAIANHVAYDAQRLISKRHPGWNLDETDPKEWLPFCDRVQRKLPDLTDHEQKLLIIELVTADSLRDGIDPNEVYAPLDEQPFDALSAAARLYALDVKSLFHEKAKGGAA
jgi:ParB/RepB/Spo0J family partition protein